MVQKLNKIIFSIFLLLSFCSFSQENEGVKPPKVTDYKNDTSYNNFHNLRNIVAKAQINLLKKDGALLIRLKTNHNTINRFKAAGNIDMATQVEKETDISNKIIMASYIQEFTFCPVYFFYSDYSDSVKHKKFDGIFVDSTLHVNSTIVCDKNFVLIAEQGTVLNSSLGIVSESLAEKSVERGSPSREAPVVIKNRYYIQLQPPFPVFQIRGTSKEAANPLRNVESYNLTALYYNINKITNHSREAKQLIKLKEVVRAINNDFENFYSKNKGYILPAIYAEYIY